MHVVDSDSRVTAQLSRLIGIAEAQLDDRISEAALQAAAALSDFNAACEVRTRCLSAAAAIAAGGDTVASKVTKNINCAMTCANDREAFSCAMEVVLILLEGASVQGSPPPDGQRDILYVTGQHGWLHKHRWVLATACKATVLGGRFTVYSAAQSPGSLQREVVSSAAIACVPTCSLVKKGSSSLSICLPHATRPKIDDCAMKKNVPLFLVEVYSTCTLADLQSCASPPIVYL